MRKNVLLLFLTLLVGVLTAGAYNVRFSIDTPSNIRVITQAGYGDELFPTDGGMLTVDDSDNPLLIEPAANAEITELMLNGEPATPSGDGKYRIGITQNSMISIQTTGGAANQDLNVMFFVMAEDYNNQSVTIKYDGDKEVSNGISVQVPSGTDFTITPAAAYEITSVDPMGKGTAVANGDGSYTYTATANDAYVYVYTKGTGVKFNLNVDFAQNLVLLAGMDEPAQVTLYSGNNTLNLPADKQPLAFMPADGAQIIKVTRNGEEVVGSPYSGIRSEFKAGDEFVVSTLGKPVEVAFSVPADNASLDNYTFAVGETEYPLSGMEGTATMHLGDVVTVLPKGAAKLTYLYGGQYIDSNHFRVAAENTTVYVYGEAATGVTVNVDDAARVIVKQANGYGDMLSLVSGSNNFALSEIANSLQVTAAEGCQILSVSLDGVVATPGHNGAYLIDVTEGCYIEITSREIPSNLPVSFSVVPSDLFEGVEVTVAGQPIELTEEVTLIAVPFGAEVSVVARKGYIIDSCSAGNNVVEQFADNSYRFVALQGCTVAVALRKIVATPGYALVNVSADNASISFLEYQDGEYVQSLTTDNVNEVRIGDIIQIRTFASALFFKSITVNGEPYDYDINSRTVSIEIEGPCDIVVESYYKVDVSTYNTTDPVNYSSIGKLYVLDNGEPVQNVKVAVGETIHFVTEVAAGYKLEYIKRIYPESDVQYGDSYTVTEEDLEAETVIFEGVYSLVGDIKSYVIRCENSYITDGPDGYELIGYTRILEDNVEYNERRYLEGDEVILLAYGRDDYEFEGFMLWRDNSVSIPEHYIVNGEDADSEGVISIQGKFVKRDIVGVETVESAGAMSYDKYTQTLSSASSIEVYTVSGLRVLSSEAGDLDVSKLQDGLYIAVSGKSTLKFTK